MRRKPNAGATALRNRHVITFADYQRMFRVIASVLNSIDAKTPNACIFFSVAGAFLIEQVHKRPARPVAGAAFYRVDDATGFTIAFGRLFDDGVASDMEAFHCWIESDGIAIDLMAPLFQESVASGGRSERVPRRMFQKPLAEASSSPYVLDKEGDFFLQRNSALEAEMMANFLRRPSGGDLVNVCLHWYRRLPKTMQPILKMASNDGSVRTIHLNQAELAGAW